MLRQNWALDEPTRLKTDDDGERTSLLLKEESSGIVHLLEKNWVAREREQVHESNPWLWKIWIEFNLLLD